METTTYIAVFCCTLMFLLSGINHIIGVFCKGAACDANPLSRILRMPASSSTVKALIFTAGLIEIAGALTVMLSPLVDDEEKQKDMRYYGAWTLLSFTVVVTLGIKVTRLFTTIAFAGIYPRLIPILSNIAVGGGLYLITKIE